MYKSDHGRLLCIGIWKNSPDYIERAIKKAMMVATLCILEKLYLQNAGLPLGNISIWQYYMQHHQPPSRHSSIIMARGHDQLYKNILRDCVRRRTNALGREDFDA